MTADRPNAALLVGRTWHLLRALAIPFATAAAVIVLCSLTEMAVAAAPLSMVGASFFAMYLWSRPRAKRTTGALAVVDGALTLDGRPIARASELRGGHVVPGAPEGTLLRLERGSFEAPVELAVPDVHVGRAILEELGLDAARVAATFRVRAVSAKAFEKRTRAIYALPFVALALVVITMLFGVRALPIVLSVFLPALAAFVVALTYPTFLTVGTDGIVARRLGRERFVPLSSIADVELVEGEPILNDVPVVMRLIGHDGAVLEDVLVELKRHGFYQESAHAAIDARAAALAERVLAALEVRRRGGEAAIDPRALARGGLRTAEWLDHLRVLLDARETFRDAAAPTPDALLAIVEDPSASPEVRAAAAVAAHASGEEARRRIRAVAEATAAPKLRIALQAAADDDPARLEAAMDELDAPERSRA